MNPNASQDQEKEHFSNVLRITLQMRFVNGPHGQSRHPSTWSVSIHPLTLKFSEAELERAFAYREAEKDFVLTTKWFNTLSFLLLFAFGFSMRMAEAWKMQINLTGLYFFQYVTLRITPMQRWIRYRFLFHLGMRLTRLASFIWWLPVWVVPKGNVNILLSLINRSGVSILFWHGWGSKLLFHQYILLHGFLTGAVAIWLSPYVCSNLEDRPEAQDWILSAWNFISSFFGSRWDLHSQSDVYTVDNCSFLLLILHAIYAFSLPTLMVWATEIHSRDQFVNEMARTERRKDIHLNSCWDPEIVFPNGEPTSTLCAE